jgi:hypothetical protein
MHQLILDLFQDIAQKHVNEKEPKLSDPLVGLSFSSIDENINLNPDTNPEISSGNTNNSR